MTVSNEPSEYGGYPGLIQPPPHEPTAYEQMRIVYQLDPADAEDNVDAAKKREGDVLL